MLFDSEHVEIGSKMAKIVQIMCKLQANCVKVCEGVSENVSKYHHLISQLEYILFDNQCIEIRPKMAEIAKLHENCVKVSEGVRESVRIFFYTIRT